jgi:hypothetical protein
MSDIVERLRHCSENCGDEYLRELTGKAADTITRLTAEIEKLKADLAFADAQCVKVEGLFLGTHKENEKLKSALCVCELELNAYYRMKYPGDHPHSQKELAKAMASNPATVALKENSDG